MTPIRNLLRAIATYAQPQYVLGLVKALLSNSREFQYFRAGRYRIRCRPPSYIAQYRSIFLERCYALSFHTNTPKILDLGANVGFSVAFFKSEHPNASIVAWEADPELFGVLDDNCHRNRFDQVTLINKAAWIEDARLEFLPNGLGGGRLTSGRSESKSTCQPVLVEGIDLRRWLEGRHFDLVKIDIEGAEGMVIRHCMDQFASAQFLAFEYHSLPEARQDLGEILCLLEDHGYRYHIRPDEGILRPFTRCRGHFDMQLFIVAEKKTFTPHANDSA